MEILKNHSNVMDQSSGLLSNDSKLFYVSIYLTFILKLQICSRAANPNIRETASETCLYCAMVCYKKEKSHLRSRLPGKSLCPQPVQKTSLSGLYCLESDCSPSFPLPSFLLRCHNGGRPGLDGGEMGVIKSDPRGAVWGWHTCGIAISPESSRPLCCRRMLLD